MFFKGPKECSESFSDDLLALEAVFLKPNMLIMLLPNSRTLEMLRVPEAD